MKEKIRLIIWDLDDTFWKGTLSEGPISFWEENINIIKTLTDRGIINSICSKNDFNTVKGVLSKKGLWDYFVFPSISWQPKGPQVKAIIDNIKLRPETILFIDDNTSNIEEVKYYNPNINVATPDIIHTILESPFFEGKDDRNHSRLQQYKVLEQKCADEKLYADNTEFLRHSNIRVRLNNDCAGDINRIWELNQRTNQLNFTKNRVEKSELERIINSKDYYSITVSVIDNYGDYGIVGFAAVRNDVLEHFYFSCRTIGLGVEQFVYYSLSYPKLNIVGSVANPVIVGLKPDWINVATAETVSTEKKGFENNRKILIMGGCDLKQTTFYIEQFGIDFDSQFNYLVNGRFECHPESLELLRQGVELKDEEKRAIVNDCVFYDNKVFDTKLFSNTYDVVVFSPLIDMAIGIYKSKSTGRIVTYGNFDFPNLSSSGYLTKEEQELFLRDYEFMGHMTPNRFASNIEFLRNNLPESTKLILLNSSEQVVNHPLEPERHLLHKEFNKVLDDFIANHDNVKLIDIRKIVNRQSLHTDTIRHYQRNVYYNIALNLIEILKDMNIIKSVNSDVVIKKQKIDYRMYIKTILRKIGLLKLFYNRA